MSLRGALTTMAAEEVLEWAAAKKLAAAITFERKDVVRCVTVDRGHIVWASSNQRDEQLGMILAHSGFIGERELADALEARAQTGVPLGKVLLMSGRITEGQLAEILSTKIRETVTDILAWPEGAFELVPRQPSATIGVEAQLPIDVCLTVARRRTARATAILEALGGDDVSFYVPPNATPPVATGEHPIDLAKLWALADDHRSAAALAAAFSGERYLVYDLLVQMVDAEQLVIDRRVRERTNSAVELAAGSRSRLRQGDRAGALAMASQALQQDPTDAVVRKTFARSERARVAELAKQLLVRHRVPKRLREPTAELAANLGLTDDELELARRVDGRWDILSLVRAAPIAEAKALLAFASLAERGVIELG